MRPGTPGFLGERLVEAREARDMTMQTLADLVDVSRQSISLYENNRQTPGPEVLRKLAQFLNIPVSFFMTTPPPPEGAPIFFRSMAKATKSVRTRAMRLLGWLRTIFAFTERNVELPPMNLPKFDVPPEPSRLTARDMERLAQETRRHWGMGDGPIPNLTWLLENNGVIVGRVPIDDDTMDGLSQWGAERPAVLVNADKACAVRSRMDVAHELGHLILHRLIDDKRLSRSVDFGLIEKQAFYFAGAFLLPARVFAPLAHAATLDSLLDLKAKWKVSLKAMIVRAGHLGVMSVDRQRRLYIAYSKRGYHANEPLDDEIPIETPRVFGRAVDLLLSSGSMSKESISADVELSASDIERLGSLRPGFLTDSESSAVAFEPRLKTQPSADRFAGGGDVIPFPGTVRRTD